METTLVEAVRKDLAIKQAQVQVAIEAEREIIASFFQSKHNGRPAGSGWNRSTNNARWGTDYWSAHCQADIRHERFS